MARFRDGELDVLVGTTVVEVGVDVPEATVMVIEDADRFGLAQLHQLRGRVGRGTAASFCVLVSRRRPTGRSARRSASRRVRGDARDGFELAETDFELRREGDVLGLAQSGLPRLRVASLPARPSTAASRRDARGTPRRCSTTTGGCRAAAAPAARAELAARLAALASRGEPASRGRAPAVDG